MGTRFVSVNLMGGLGNQIYQIAAMYAVHITTGRIMTVVRNDTSPSITPRSTYWDSFFKRIGEKIMKFHVADLPGSKSTITEQSFSFDPSLYDRVLSCGSNVVILNGYFQSGLYFDTIRDRVVDMFCDSESINVVRQRYTSIVDNVDNICVIHVRRGDYLKLQHCHRVLDIEYYKTAASIISSKSSNTVEWIIFSDDHDYIRDNFGFLGNYTIINDIDYAELQLMTQFKKFIIANSTFSWWGAWLSNYNDKIVIAPKVWFNSGGPSNHSLICDGWITI
jgi:hypothetical protein